MSDLIFLHGHGTPRCAARIEKYFAGYATLQFVSEGAVELFYDETRHVLKGRAFWSTWAGPRVRFHAAPGHDWWNHRYIAFQGPRVARWQAAGLYPFAPQSLPEAGAHGEWERRFDEMLGLSRQAGNFSTLRAAHLLEGLLLDLAERRITGDPQSDTAPWLQKVLHELENSNDFAPDYAAIAASCGMGLSTLRRRFKVATGTALHNYVLQNRVAHARHLLTETDLPIKVIAAQLGYADVYFFAAQFRRVTGVAPATYRRSRLFM